MYNELTDPEQQNIRQAMGPCAESVLQDESIAQFLLRKWSDQEAE